ncbi:MAG: AraC family transcriptional regulator [Microbacter sp.]
MLAATTLQEITPLSEKDCFYIVDRTKSSFTYPLHKHAECEINYVENANGTRRIVGDSMEVIGDYDLVLITGKELEHTWEDYRCESQTIREITIQFSSELLSPALLNKNQFKSIQKMFEMGEKGLLFPLKTILSVKPMLTTLAHEKQGFYAVMKFFSLLYELSISDDTRTLASDAFSKSKNTIESRRVQKIHDFLNTHFTEEIRLSQLAESVNMTEASFSRFFKQRTGKSVTDYLLDIRIGNATRLLVDSSQTIGEICFNSGFNNLSNFNRLFRKRKGCSPKEFRDNYHKKRILV